MRASDVYGVDRRARSNIRIEKRWTNNRSNYVIVAVTCDGGRVAVSNPEGWHALFSGTLHCLDRIPKALSETDGDEHILRSQDLYFMLYCSSASRWRLCVEAKRRQSVCQIKGQRSSEV